MKKKIGVWITIFFIVLAVISLFQFLSIRNRELFAEQIIEEASATFKKDIKTFLRHVELLSSKIKNDATKIDVDIRQEDSLDFYLTNLILKEELLKGVILFGNQMNYVLLQDNNSWIMTHSRLSDSILNWQRLNTKLEPVSTWTQSYNYFMKESDLKSIKIEHLKNETEIWRAAKSKIPENRDLLFNIFKLNTPDGKLNVAVLIYKTSELSGRFNELLTYEQPLVTLITTNKKTITPIRTTDTNQIKKYDELSKKVQTNISEWYKIKGKQPHTYQFEEFKQLYWTRIDTINSRKGIKGYALTVSDKDLKNTKIKEAEVYLYVAVLFIIFAFFIYLATFRKHSKKNTKSNNSLFLREISSKKTMELIGKGETEFVEFKSSLRWDYKENSVNKILEEVILKSIAAFANAKGGKLFMGVNDDSMLIGLQNDFNSLKKKDADYFELHLRKLINNQFGIKFSNNYLRIQFISIHDITICIIHIAPSDNPLYLSVKNKQGQTVEKFYVRSGNASQEISSLQEINDYINDRF